jgi:hypothetical protein
MWGLFGFSPAAGLVFLTLLPAIRRGSDYIRDNGSPWPWPYFPWSLFLFLAVAVVGRSFLLCWSLHLLDTADKEDLIFGPYFLVPFGLAIAVLVLELGIVSRHRGVQAVAMLLPAGLVVLAGVGHRPEGMYAEFLATVTTRLGGSPAYLTLLAAGAFYGLAWLRGVPLAADAFTAALAALAVVCPQTVDWDQLSRPHLMPLLAAALMQLGLGMWRRNLWRCVLGGAGPAAWLGVIAWRAYCALRTDVAGLDYLAGGLALLPIAVLVSLAKAGVLARWASADNGREFASGTR